MRIFKEKDYKIFEKLLPYDQFKLYSDSEEGFTINPAYYDEIVAKAESILPLQFNILPASEYMMFKRDGNRSIYQSHYFPLREHILYLALAEYVEKKGRFVDKLIDILWSMLEETSWVIPAHNPPKEGYNTCLPYAYAEEVDYIDLFSASTGACIAFVYYLCKDEFDKVSNIITERMLYELNRRIIKPFLNPVFQSKKMGWTGVNGNRVNNWCPWIVSNVLTITALTVKEREVREAVVRNALPMLDNFTSVYHSDGGCDEGPSYWSAAGGALFNACMVLYDMSGGYINVYDNQLFKNMGEYVVKVIITGGRGLNFADAPARVRPNATLIYEWGKRVGSEMMMSYAKNRLDGQLPKFGMDSSEPYRGFKYLCSVVHPKEEFVSPTKFWLDGIQIAGTRESSDTNKGLYLAIKGGTNAESHNHNDIGNIVVFADGQPMFLDAGSGTYTRRTFGKERYTIWAMNSDYHNCATINGVIQQAGIMFKATDPVYNEENGSLTLNLKNAYPTEADINNYHRTAVLENSTITITDDIELNNEGEAMFSFICNEVPSEVTENSFVLKGRTVSFDSDLEYNIEELDKTWPEVKGIPAAWDTDFIRRITLKTKTKFVSKKFVITIK